MHDIGQPADENAGEILCPSVALLEGAFSAAAETESPPDLLFEIDCDAVEGGADMKNHSIRTEFGESEKARKKKRSKPLHDINAFGSRRKFYFAVLWTIRMK